MEEYEGEESPLEPEDISDVPEFEKRPLPIEQTDAIFAFGRISLTSGVISFFSKYSVPIHFFGYYGHYESTLIPKDSLLSGEMHIRQASWYLDQKKRLALAKKFVTGSAANILKNLEYYRNEGKPVEGEIADIRAFMEQAETIKNVGQLLAAEGNIRSLYYSTFDKILKKGFSFGGRSRQPAGKSAQCHDQFRKFAGVRPDNQCYLQDPARPDDIVPSRAIGTAFFAFA